MTLSSLENSVLLGSLAGLVIFVSLVVLALVANLILKFILNRRRTKNPDGLDIGILEAVRGPAVLFLILFGAFLGYWFVTRIDHPVFEFLEGLGDWADKIWFTITVAVVSYVIAHLLQVIIRWYVHHVSASTRSAIDTKLGPTINRLLPVIVYMLGALIILDAFEISISPLLAGFGIGGLAIALALTPTISSFISGTYVVTEGQLKERDYIEMDDGTAGFVQSIGWRSTTVRSRFNNLTIIPNNKLTESVVTNYSTPTPRLVVMEESGVSYDSDLEKVESIALEVAGKIVEASEFAVKDFDPLVRFDEFGDSNIEFRIIVQATDRIGGFALKSEMIKLLHTRFKEEGIEINYPIRRLIFPESNGRTGSLLHREGDPVASDNSGE